MAPPWCNDASPDPGPDCHLTANGPPGIDTGSHQPATLGRSLDAFLARASTASATSCLLPSLPASNTVWAGLGLPVAVTVALLACLLDRTGAPPVSLVPRRRPRCLPRLASSRYNVTVRLRHCDLTVTVWCDFLASRFCVALFRFFTIPLWFRAGSPLRDLDRQQLRTARFTQVNKHRPREGFQRDNHQISQTAQPPPVQASQ